MREPAYTVKDSELAAGMATENKRPIKATLDASTLVVEMEVEAIA